MSSNPSTDRYNTISPALYSAEANFTHTPITANSSDAPSMSSAPTSGIHVQAQSGSRPMRRRYHSWKCCMPSSIGLW
jgi:hypothetical protein